MMTLFESLPVTMKPAIRTVNTRARVERLAVFSEGGATRT
jgi:hypothetical protein